MRKFQIMNNLSLSSLYSNTQNPQSSFTDKNLNSLEESITFLAKNNLPRPNLSSTVIKSRTLFEIVPPPMDWDQNNITNYYQQVAKVLHEKKSYRISIPEVVDEQREGEVRTIPFNPKQDPLSFADQIKKYVLNLEPIPFKVSVVMPKIKFEQWIKESYDKGLREVVIAGGESSKRKYEGYQVPEAIRYIKQNYPDIKVGVVTIFSRKEEASRMMTKLKAGADFFYTQILFEMEDGKTVLKQFLDECKKENLPFPAIYLSLAVASQSRDIRFMKWLGVKFPVETFNYLTEIADNPEIISSRTFEVTEKLIKEIITFTNQEGIPLGFKVEPVMYDNLELSQKLYDQIIRLNQEIPPD